VPLRPLPQVAETTLPGRTMRPGSVDCTMSA
jgi:hypothetical protein